MENLFFIHTPFQLFVAQQLIAQENLTNNILLYGYVYTNRHFVDIYDAMIVDNLWAKKIAYPGVAGWAIGDYNRPLESISSIRNNYKRLTKIIKDNNIGKFYFGDIHNASYQLLSKIYKDKIQSVYFEEGSSHYYNTSRVYNRNRIKESLICAYFDAFVFLPLWGFRYAKQFYFDCLDYSEIPLSERFSIIPAFHESFDKTLKINKQISKRTEAIITKELTDIDTSNSVLFISEPVIEGNPKQDASLKAAAIKEYFIGHTENEVVIKFHPRETDVDKKAVINVFKSLGIKYTVIGKDLNLPIEYYLQIVNFKYVYTFYASTMLYNGYIFKKTKFVSLLSIANTIYKKRTGEEIPYYKSVKDDNRFEISFA